jgi:hypothetical protein
MLFDLLITGIIFLIVITLFLIWKPTRVILKEIFFRPLQESTLKIVEDQEISKTVKVTFKDDSNNTHTNKHASTHN